MDTKGGLKKILLVDDNDIHLLIASNILKDKYETVTAKSGKDALGLLTKGLVPCLILLDVLMPEMDGWETYNKIKGIGLLRNVPVAFVTSLDGVREKLYASSIGASDFITKPYDRDQLLKKVEEMLERKPELN